MEAELTNDKDKSINVSAPEGKIIPKTPKPEKKYSQAYKLRILELGSKCRTAEELQALLKRENLHAAQLNKWYREFSDQVSMKQVLSKQAAPVIHAFPSHLEEPGQRIDRRAPAGNDVTVNPKEIFARIWRNKWLLVGTIALFMMLVFWFLKTATPTYNSTAMVLIGNRTPDAVKSSVSDLQLDAQTVQNELEILRSYTIAELVIDRLKLDTLTEFNPALENEQVLKTYIEKFAAQENQIQAVERKPQLGNIPPERVLVIEQFLKRLTLHNIQDSRVIQLSYRSQNPLLAADIANTLLEVYLDQQRQEKYAKTDQANEWLNKRVAELRQKVKESETAVEEFREASGLIETSKGNSLYAQQLTELNTQLILAGTERAEKDARLRQVRGSNVESSSEVLNSASIRRLREQETGIDSQIAELSTSYGSKHPRLVTLNAEKAEIQQKISAEINKIVAGLRNEANIAQIRESKLRTRMAELESKLAGSSQQEVELRELEREAEANRNLLASFLTRAKETDTQKDISVQNADAKVISYATVAREPNFPKPVPTVVLGLFVSVIMGLIAVFLRELFDRGFRSTVDLERDTRLPCLGLIPRLGKFSKKLNSPEAYVQKYPASPLSESIRSLFAGVQFNQSMGGMPKVVQFTSTHPGEGKSTIARCLAILKRQAGMKTIVIDADIRNPSLHKVFKSPLRPGLADYLNGKVALHQIIRQHKSGVYVITAGMARKSPTDLLPQEALDILIKDLSEVFDLIVLDSPPVLAAPDARLISPRVDMTVMVVKWADTQRDKTRYALKLLKDAGAHRLSTVISLVDARKHAKYSYADSGIYIGNLKKYYSTDKA